MTTKLISDDKAVLTLKGTPIRGQAASHKDTAPHKGRRQGAEGYIFRDQSE